MLVVGFNWPNFHDNSAAAVLDGKLVYAAEEERYTLHKHAPYELPENSLRHCLLFLQERYGIKPNDVDAYAINFDPKFYSAKSKAWHNFSQMSMVKDYLLKADSAAEAYSLLLKSITRSITSRLDFTWSAKVFVRSMVRSLGYNVEDVKIIPVRHHLAHAASAYYFSGMSSGIGLVVDGQGETDATTAWRISDGNFEELLSVKWYEGSLGYLYEFVSKYLGFGRLEGPGKVMGLAPYGKIDKKMLARLEALFDLNAKDGPYLMKKRLSAGIQGEMYNSIARRAMGIDAPIDIGGRARLNKKACDYAYTLQSFFETLLTKTAEWSKDASGMDRIMLSGGSALNAKANMELYYSKKFNRVFVFPAAGDAGTSIGAAAYVYANGLGGRMRNGELKDLYLGDEYSGQEVKTAVISSKLKYERIDSDMNPLSGLLESSKVIGFYHGRAEFGPRALGNRSIIGNPMEKSTWPRINRIKGRAWWRPLAPSLLAKSMNDYFIEPEEHEFMVMMYRANKGVAARVPAVIHVDGTARPQTVRREKNAIWHDLIKCFGDSTSENLIVNTSFNMAGEPLVETPMQAIRSFSASGLDALYLDGWLIRKHA